MLTSLQEALRPAHQLPLKGLLFNPAVYSGVMYLREINLAKPVIANVLHSERSPWSWIRDCWIPLGEPLALDVEISPGASRTMPCLSLSQ